MFGNGKKDYLFLSDFRLFICHMIFFCRAEDFIPSTERLAPPSEKPPPLPPVPPPMIEVIYAIEFKEFIDK